MPGSYGDLSFDRYQYAIGYLSELRDLLLPGVNRQVEQAELMAELTTELTGEDAPGSQLSSVRHPDQGGRDFSISMYPENLDGTRFERRRKDWVRD